MAKVREPIGLIEPQKAQRKQITPGDIFTIKISGKGILFGRVIETGITALSEDNVLIYVYQGIKELDSKVTEFAKESLLVPPTIIAKSSWTTGYFNTVDHKPLHKDDVWPAHFFYRNVTRKIVDQYGQPVVSIDGCPPMIGSYGLTMLHGLSKEIAYGLGCTDPVLIGSRTMPPWKDRMEATAILLGAQN